MSTAQVFQIYTHTKHGVGQNIALLVSPDATISTFFVSDFLVQFHSFKLLFQHEMTGVITVNQTFTCNVMNCLAF